MRSTKELKIEKVESANRKDFIELYFNKDSITFECGFIKIQAESLYDLAWNVNVDWNISKLSVFVLEILKNSASMGIEYCYIYGDTSEYAENSYEDIDIENGMYRLNKYLNEYNCWTDREEEE